MGAAPGRMDALDGLRRWAALSVAGYHFFWETFGVRFPEIRNPVAALFINGHLAVTMFFVLSGYVLTVNQWSPADKAGTLRHIAKRYGRLMIPVLCASAIVFLLMARAGRRCQIESDGQRRASGCFDYDTRACKARGDDRGWARPPFVAFSEMQMADIESLARARKAKKRAKKQIVAAENRTRYGRTKAEKLGAAKEQAAEQKKLDGHKRQDNPGD